MNKCMKHKSCPFVMFTTTNSKIGPTLDTIVKTYCEGLGQNVCVRKKIGDLIGSAKVPLNMMPNGQALKGTTTIDWSDDVMRLIQSKKLMSTT